MKIKSALAVSFLILALALCLAPATRAADHPLSADDVTLLLIGGASPQKMISLIEQRGISFHLNPDLVKQFYQDGATDEVIDALQKASRNVKAPAPASTVPPATPAAPAAAPGPEPNPGRAPAREIPAQRSAPAPATATVPPVSSASRPAASTATSPNAPKPPALGASKTSSPPPSNAPLSDPSPAQIQNIIRTFAAKEKLFKEARDNYAYHQINKVETLNADNQVSGMWEQDWDILFDNNGQRIERVTYAPESTLQGLLVTEQDLQSLRNIQPFVLTTDELPEYDVRYLGHVHVDYITAYVFSVRPKEIKKGKVYFKGVVWVDDHDLQIVKAEGRTVPEMRTKNGQNLFPRFTTWRQQIDGKYWFPTFTMADDTLYFDSGPIHIKEIIKYTDYKQFKSKVRIISSTPINEPNPSGSKPNSKPKQ
ncbi:MAG TPA: hypothetical protein VFZ08_03920 [Terriglobia bacterium]|nr:hypothetical protein [Terriglobia bacterium]